MIQNLGHNITEASIDPRNPHDIHQIHNTNTYIHIYYGGAQ